MRHIYFAGLQRSLLLRHSEVAAFDAQERQVESQLFVRRTVVLHDVRAWHHRRHQGVVVVARHVLFYQVHCKREF